MKEFDEVIVSAQELLKLTRNGTKDQPDKHPQIEARAEGLIGQIDRLVQAMNASAEADIAKTNTLNKMLVEIQKNTERKAGSGFEVEVTTRNNMGGIQKMRVTPIKRTLN